MPLDFVQLARIHGLLQQRAELESRLGRIPKLIKDVDAAMHAAAASRDATKESLTAAKKRSHEQQLHLKQREDRIENLKVKLNTSETNREYQILKDQIAADMQANGVLSDEILDLLGRVESLELELASMVENVKGVERECELSRNQLRQRESVLRSELDSVEKELKQCERILSGEVGDRYRRLVSTRGPGALSETDGETCGECHQVLTVQTRSELFQLQTVFCKGCGSLMYLSAAAIADRNG